jgi:hypothetical protein
MTKNSLEPGTSPEDLPNNSESQKKIEPEIVKTGIAIRYWLELVPYPEGSTRSLWLFVNDDWRHLDNPDPSTQIAVQDAFCKCPGSLEVQVWYSGDLIRGLLVRTK